MTEDAFRCKYCGGFINPMTYRCEYCGTQYMVPRVEGYGEPIRVITANAPVEVIGVQRRIDRDTCFHLERMGINIENHIRRDFADEIAKNIAPRLDIHEDIEIVRCEKIYTAKLRIVKPDYKF